MRNDVNKFIKSEWRKLEDAVELLIGCVEHHKEEGEWRVKEPISVEYWDDINVLKATLAVRAQTVADIRYMMEGIEYHLQEIVETDDFIFSRIDELEEEEVA